MHFANILELHWASNETYQFFRATLTKILSIKMNHIWTQFSYIYSYLAKLKEKGLLESKRRKMRWNRKRSFSKKSQKVLASPASWEFPADKSTYGGYITRHWTCSLLNLLNRLPPWSSLGEQFLWFRIELPFAISPHFLLFDTIKLFFFRSY